MPISDSAPSRAAIRAELERILASPYFNASPRKAGFLRYVVEQTLAGATDRLGAYDIAVHVLGRDERFDPQTDPLVRIAARRVREALDRYYLTVGDGDSLRIAIPRGHYMATFELASAAAGSTAASPTLETAIVLTPPVRRSAIRLYLVVGAILLSVMLALSFARSPSLRYGEPAGPRGTLAEERVRDAGGQRP